MRNEQNPIINDETETLALLENDGDVFFEAPATSKAAVKAYEQRARLKAAKIRKIKKAKQRKLLDEDRNFFLAKQELMKNKHQL